MISSISTNSQALPVRYHYPSWGNRGPNPQWSSSLGPTPFPLRSAACWLKEGTHFFLGSSFKWDLHRLSQLYRNQEISFGFTPRTIPPLLSSWECRPSCGLSICVWPDRMKDGQETCAPGAPWQQLQHLLTSDPRHRHPSTHSPGPGLEPRARVTPSPKCQPS